MDVAILSGWVKKTGGSCGPDDVRDILDEANSYLGENAVHGGTRWFAAIALARLMHKLGALDRLAELADAPCEALGVKMSLGEGRQHTLSIAGADAWRHAVAGEVPCSSLLDVFEHFLACTDRGDCLRTAFPDFGDTIVRIHEGDVGALVTARMGPPIWRRELSVGVTFGTFHHTAPIEGKLDRHFGVLSFRELAQILDQPTVSEARPSVLH